MFENLEKQKASYVEQLENYYFFLKGWNLSDFIENFETLTRKEKRFYNIIDKKIKAIDLLINTELF